MWLLIVFMENVLLFIAGRNRKAKCLVQGNQLSKSGIGFKHFVAEVQFFVRKEM